MQHVREIDGAAAQAMRGASQCNNRFPGSHVPVRRAKVLRGPRVANWSRDLKEYIRSVKFGERLFSIIEADDGLDPVLMGGFALSKIPRIKLRKDKFQEMQTR